MLSLLTNHRRICRSREGFLYGEHRLRHICPWFPTTKILIDEGDGLVRIEVTGHTDRHVIGHVPLLEVVLDIHDRRVLQVFLRTDGGLGTVRMRRCEFLT